MGPTDVVGRRWQFDTGDEDWNVVDASPAVVDGTVDADSRDGSVYALWDPAGPA